MTEERSSADTDGITDPLVSRTYRETASESVPAGLDQAVLRQAKREGGRRYSRSVVWLRPMAWAATIGLCLAIVIELSNVPQLDSALIEVPAAARVNPEIKGKVDSLAEPETLEEIRSDIADGVTAADAAPRYEAEQLEQRARKTVDEDGRVNLQSIPQLNKTDLVPAVSAPAAALGPKRSASELDSLGASAGLSAVADLESPCDADAQATPELWLECIAGLEDDGRDDLADLQREQLQEAFPSFVLP